MRVTTNNLIVEVMAARSGTSLLAREIGHHLSTVYNRGISPKAISKRILALEDDYPLLRRRPTTNDEKARYNCRYMYLWGNWTNKENTP